MGIYYRTNKKEMPKSCRECQLPMCYLPQKQDSHGNIKDEIKKQYLDKRHKECPLVEIDSE